MNEIERSILYSQPPIHKYDIFREFSHMTFSKQALIGIRLDFI